MPDLRVLPSSVNLQFGLNDQPQSLAAWHRLRSEENLHMVASDTWPCQIEDPMAAERGNIPVVIDDQGEAKAMLYVVGEASVFVRLGFGSCTVVAAAETMQQADQALLEMETVFPRHEVIDNGRIPITFWAYTPHGPQAHTREVAVPAWKDIRAFYNEGEREEVDALMDPSFVPGRGGQLILWRGIPGTGKTTALRALGHAWRDWARLHVIADPERFFGDHADYMLQVMLGAGAQEAPRNNGKKPKEEPKWRILVLEDAGELLVKDSKQKVGQALSRFLNAVDGLIGQGLRFLVLVTTNEDDMGQLNEAVGRHGRAAANIEFKALEPQLAEDVLTELRRGAGKEGSLGIVRALTKGNHLPLADVFALAEDRQREETRQAVGFTA